MYGSVLSTASRLSSPLPALISGIALNSQMRRIDLICKLGGPLFIALVDGLSTQVAIFLTLGMNIVSIPIEYFTIGQVSSSQKLM